MLDEGYVKFMSRWIAADPLPAEAIADLKRWRDRLRANGLIGVYPDGVGFGNVSVRSSDNPEHFIITGTQTGEVLELEPRHVTTVIEVDIDRNSLTCAGPIEASSESMTHAAFYRCDRSIGAVIHVHHLPTWNALRDHVSTTRADVPYGTPEMAREIGRLYHQSDLRREGIVIMAGHREGIIAFGKDLDEAGSILMRWIA
jgi:ribulose-5-phosphate 4-epimerase/fuculose-1-phosphate aldolase